MQVRNIRLENFLRQVFSSSKLTAAFQSMEVRNSTFACFIELLTPNTYVMVVISDPSICKSRLLYYCYLLKTFSLLSASEVTLMNIRNARKVFEKLEKDVARN